MQFESDNTENTPEQILFRKEFKVTVAERTKQDHKSSVYCHADAARGDESASEPDGDVLAQIASYYGLTRRDAEVLPYLARGRSAKVLAEALFVSESTVRTHTRRILEKTALHSKQDLIDLIEKYE